MLHALVVEEGRRLRGCLVQVLADSGYVVAEAPDARTALERVRQRRPDVIIHGHITPMASELLLARRLDPELSGIPLVMTFAQPELAEDADVILGERFTLDDLLAALTRCRERAHVGARRPALAGRRGPDAPAR